MGSALESVDMAIAGSYVAEVFQISLCASFFQDSPCFLRNFIGNTVLLELSVLTAVDGLMACVRTLVQLKPRWLDFFFFLGLPSTLQFLQTSGALSGHSEAGCPSFSHIRQAPLNTRGWVHSDLL